MSIDELQLAALRLADVGLCLVDADFRYQWVNGAFADLLGVEASTLLGRSFLDVTHPDDVDLDRDLSDAAFAGEIPYFVARKRYLRGDGSILVGEMLATVVRDEAGTPIAGLATLIDASEAEPVSKRIARLQGSAAAGQVAIGAAHEFGNSLAALRECVERLPADQAALATTMAAELDRSQGLVSAITGVVGSTTGIDAYDVADLIGDVVPIAELILPPGVRLRLAMDADGARVAIPPAPFRQVMLNLLLNARDALSTAGGAITITASTADDGALVDVCVLDTGPGIDDADRERVFDAYYTTKGEEGSGLGLHISREIVERHGGRLTADPQPQGSCFRLRLPTS